MRILCVTAVRNEAPFLLEWIAHYKGAGVTDFLIYSNDCDDGTVQLLDLLDAAGEIEHIPQQLKDGKSPQWSAFRAAWKHPKRKECDWAIVCDVDEFLNVHAGGHCFADLLASVPEGTDGILIPWRLFGNNHISRFADRPVTEQFTASAGPDLVYPISSTFFKSLIRTSGPFNQFGVHRPKQKSAEKHPLPNWVNGNGDPMPDVFAKNEKRLSLYGLPNGRRLVECNHYSLKSAESFLVKRARGLPNRTHKKIDLGYWVDRNFNDITNTSISSMSSNTNDALTALHAIMGVSTLHIQAVEWHMARFRELIQQPTEYRLFTQIAIAGDSRTPDPELTKSIIHWFQNLRND